MPITYTKAGNPITATDAFGYADKFAALAIATTKDADRAIYEEQRRIWMERAEALVQMELDPDC